MKTTNLKSSRVLLVAWACISVILSGCSSTVKVALVSQKHVVHIEHADLVAKDYIVKNIKEKNQSFNLGFHEIIISSEFDILTEIENNKLDGLYYLLQECHGNELLAAGNAHPLKRQSIKKQSLYFYAAYVPKKYWIAALEHNPDQPSEHRLRKIYNDAGICLTLSAGGMLGSSLKSNQIQIKLDGLK